MLLQGNCKMLKQLKAVFRLEVYQRHSLQVKVRSSFESQALELQTYRHIA